MPELPSSEAQQAQTCKAEAVQAEAPCPVTEQRTLGVSVAFLTGDFLKEVEERFGPDADPDFYDINKAMLHGVGARGHGKICPRDGRPNCSYVDALDGQHTGKASVMLSWAWSYSARTVVGAIAQWCTRKQKDPTCTYVWICALCNNQHRVHEKQAQGQCESFETFRDIFQSRVQGIGHMLALLSPWNEPTYIQRVWCVFEIWVALNTEGCKLDLALPDDQEREFWASLETEGLQALWRTFERVRIQDARASVAADRRNILRMVDPDAKEEHAESEKCHAINHAVIHRLQEWCIGVAACHVEGRLRQGEQVSAATCAKIATLLWQVSNWGRAISILEAGEQAARRAGATTTPEYAGLLETLGASLAHQCRHEEALAQYLAAKAVHDAAGTHNGLQYAGLLQNLGGCHFECQRHGDAMAAFLASKAAYEAAKGTSTAQFAALLQSVGECHAREGRAEEASACYDQAKAAFESLGRVGRTPKDSEVLRNMGARCTTQGRHAEAMHLFRRAKSSYEKMGSTETPQYAALLHDMGVCQGLKAQDAESLELYQAAKAAHLSAGKGSSASFAALLQNMGLCYSRLGRTREAAEEYAAAARAYETAGCGRSAEFAGLLQDMGELQGKEGNHGEALRYYTQAKSLYECLGAVASAKFAGLLHNVGASLALQGRHQEALPLFAESLAALGRLSPGSAPPGDGAPLRARLLYCLGSSTARCGDDEGALGHLETAKAAYELVDTGSNREYADLLRQMGELYLRCGRAREAEEHLRAARQGYERCSAGPSPELAGLLQLLGVNFARQDRHEEALTMYEEARSLYERSGMYGTPEYAGVLRNMGHANVSAQRMAAAMQSYEAALQAYRSLGPAHCADRARTLLELGNCRAQNGQQDKALQALREAGAVYDDLGEAAPAAERAGLLLSEGTLLARAGRAAEALVQLAGARRLLEQQGSQDTIQYAQLLHNTGATKEGQGDRAGAAGLYAEAKAAYERAGAAGSPNYSALLTAIGGA